MRVHRGNEVINMAWCRWMWFGLSPSSNGAIREVIHLDLRINTRLVKLEKCIGNEVIDMPWCKWTWFGLSTSRNGAIGKVVPFGFEQQQEIDETLKVHQKNEVIHMPWCRWCDLDCLLQGMGRLEKLSHLDLSKNRILVKLLKYSELMKSFTCMMYVDVIWIVYLREWGNWRSCLTWIWTIIKD